MAARGGSGGPGEGSHRDLSPPATSGPSLLTIPGIAFDGVVEPVTPAPEPEVIASAPATVVVPILPPPDVAVIDDFLARSPLAGMGIIFAEAAAAYGLDARLLPSIAMWESGLGTAGCAVETRNPFGLKDARNPGVTCRRFDSYADAIWAATGTFASYPVDVPTGLCWWVAGPAGACNFQYVANVLATMEGIR